MKQDKTRIQVLITISSIETEKKQMLPFILHRKPNGKVVHYLIVYAHTLFFF